MKKINFKKLNEALDHLSFIHRYVDDNAVIAGGFPLRVYCDLEYKYSDIDIFFKSPNFELGICDGRDPMELINKLSNNKYSHKVNLETYWYSKMFYKIGAGYQVDLIQVRNQYSLEDIYSKFDINLSKICMELNYYLSEDKFITIVPSKECLDGIENKEIIYELDLGEPDCDGEHTEQNSITLERVEKYKELFPDFKVIQKV